MKLIVGLGNPGLEYAQTRHNVGFMALDLLAKELKVSFNKNKYKALIADAQVNGTKILLVKPQAYMNLSGDAVGMLARWHKVLPEDIVVVYDDMDLPLGKLRIRPQGGHGGHNGMKSIIANLGSNTFARIRIGIGHGEFNSVNHVLGKFSLEEAKEIEITLDKSVQAIKTIIVENINAAMNKFNC